MPSVTFSRRDKEWVVRGESRRSGWKNQLLLVPQDLPLVSTADLRNALLSYCNFRGEERAAANVSEFPEAHFDADGPVGPIGFELVDRDLILSVTSWVDWPDSNDEQEAIDWIDRLVRPFLKQNKCTLLRIEWNEEYTRPTEIAVDLHVTAPWRGRTAADLVQLGESIKRLCEGFAAGVLARETVADIVRGHGAHLLVGQPEGNWLDAKAEEYDLTQTKGKISLAQSVARFANAEDGGLIVIGAKARKVDGGEVIRSVGGVAPRQRDTAARYLQVLNQHLYPPPAGIRIDLVPVRGGLTLIVIDLPPQPEELKPFLVHGAITPDGDVEGSFISIVQRRGEGSIPITAPMIHATMAAGRALLRGKQEMK